MLMQNKLTSLRIAMRGRLEKQLIQIVCVTAKVRLNKPRRFVEINIAKGLIYFQSKLIIKVLVKVYKWFYYTISLLWGTQICLEWANNLDKISLKFFFFPPQLDAELCINIVSLFHNMINCNLQTNPSSNILSGWQGILLTVIYKYMNVTVIFKLV